MNHENLDKLLKKYHIQLQLHNEDNGLGRDVVHKGEIYFRSYFRDADHILDPVPILLNIKENRVKGGLANNIFYEWEDLFKIYRDPKRRHTLPEFRGFIEDEDRSNPITSKVKSSKGEDVQLDRKLRDAEILHGIYRSIITFPITIIRKIKKLLDK